MNPSSPKFHLFYHPLTFALPGVVEGSRLVSGSFEGTVLPAVFMEWIAAMSGRDRDKFRFGGNCRAERCNYTRRRSAGKDGMHVSGTFVTECGNRICIDTASHFITVTGPDGDTLFRQVLPEPFPKRYKMLYDSVHGGHR